MLKKLFIFCGAIFLLASNSFARDISYIDSVLNPAKLQGSGRLNWLGFHIYDASFYRSGVPSSPEFALNIRYQKSFTGVSIANRTADEMKKMGVPDAQVTTWGKELATILPNIESGQTLTAIYTPKQGTIFYHDGKRVAQIPGVEFSKAFFGIWLDPKTSAPKLRNELLGQGCPPPLFNEAC
ncbi:chalcone isomerase family protein [Polynucleobacter sp. MWH-Berg-3C6]|uniref:chalcone isomerase family protein n=1 Tax=Polynucleobacter sp. MWH-Berg-3C6 TaxID=1855882 RepID=UPI001C0DFE50|nr:chalcone isomerase family protein [Polynucleobacter sp. MWH-Berg-3C6]MBU3550805.1 chalcone isomerase family protein [Polynucleobacter sp. MWH-Berg-3C6]